MTPTPGIMAPVTDVPPRGDTRLLVGLLLTGMVVFTVAITTGRLLGSEPGSLADWVAAMSTFAALLAAAYAAIQTRRVVNLERARDEERAEEGRRAQASQVAVWAYDAIMWRGPHVTVRMPSTGPQQMEDGISAPDYIPIRVLNASPLPVYHLSIEFYFGVPRQGPMVLGATYEHRTPVLGDIDLGDLATPDVVASLEATLRRLPGRHDEPRPMSVGWTFLDNLRVRWRYVPGGQLERYDPTS
ncbi:hypothetical protein [Nocardioides sp. Arc9.136]|uniref:hypothetical protein n=1 Tax=Nocardioides sp. Arc9.136 TaxID=2996826 RepID=UPI0026663BD1|nr:hypothetical protein [Nocardioides sp. Arc9.136]WKN47136.1 hypothetical protein OSR43_13920 [Nocardioides sp. Arc9.136]